MKKMLTAVLAAAMCVSPFISGAQALESIGKEKQVTENNRHRGYDYRRGRRYHDGGGNAGAIVAGSLLLGAAIVAATTRPKARTVYVEPAPVYVQPAPVYVQPQPQPTLVCDQYGNCWYQ